MFSTIEQKLEMYKVIFLIALGNELRQGENTWIYYRYGNSGVNIVIVAKRLGYTIETVSETYLYSIEKVKKESVSQLETFIGSNRPAK